MGTSKEVSSKGNIKCPPTYSEKEGGTKVKENKVKRGEKGEVILDGTEGGRQI